MVVQCRHKSNSLNFFRNAVILNLVVVVLVLRNHPVVRLTLSVLYVLVRQDTVSQVVVIYYL